MGTVEQKNTETAITTVDSLLLLLTLFYCYYYYLYKLLLLLLSTLKRWRLSYTIIIITTIINQESVAKSNDHGSLSLSLLLLL